MKRVTKIIAVIVTLIMFLNVGMSEASASTIKLKLPTNAKVVNKSVEKSKVVVVKSKYNTYNKQKVLTKLNTHVATSFNNGDGVMFVSKKDKSTVSVNEIDKMSTVFVSNFKNTNELKFATKVMNIQGVKESEKTLLNLMIKANKTNGTVKHKNLRITNLGNTLMIDIIK